MRDVSNIKRIMEIKDILLKNTDENHELSLLDIINQLKISFGSDYHVTKNTVKNAIEELRNCNINIEKNVVENNKVVYRYQDRKFEIHELRMLVDAVSSARFITPEESTQLIEKIKSLTSTHLAKKLHNQITVDPSVKAQNEQVRYHIDNIHTSISKKRRITFQYGNYNINKKFVLRHHGKIYDVIPLGLVWYNDYYYLVAQEVKDNAIKHFRVDRMRKVLISEDTFIPLDFDITNHMKKVFLMYPGGNENVEIHFQNQLVNVVIDRFGKDVVIRQVDDYSFSIKVNAAISEGLIRWILTWGSDAKVISPKFLADKVKEEAIKMIQLY